MKKVKLINYMRLILGIIILIFIITTSVLFIDQSNDNNNFSNNFKYEYHVEVTYFNGDIDTLHFGSNRTDIRLHKGDFICGANTKASSVRSFKILSKKTTTN